MNDALVAGTGKTFADVFPAIHRCDEMAFPLDGRYLHIGPACELWRDSRFTGFLRDVKEFSKADASHLLGAKLVYDFEYTPEWRLMVKLPADGDTK